MGGNCIICEKPRLKGRRYCAEHYNERKRESYKKRGRYHYYNTCIACNEVFEASRKTQVTCKECRKSAYTQNAYEVGYSFHKGTSIPEHRYVATQLLGRKLNSNEVVHHLNENPKDNQVTNLIVIDRRAHARLHAYLRVQRVIIEKSINENIENCWNNLRVPMTKAWLETTGAKVIKLWEIGQSAAEPLNSMEHGEGSETMYDKSDWH